MCGIQMESVKQKYLDNEKERDIRLAQNRRVIGKLQKEEKKEKVRSVISVITNPVVISSKSRYYIYDGTYVSSLRGVRGE